MMKYGSIAGGEKTTIQSARQILEEGGNAVTPNEAVGDSRRGGTGIVH